MLSHILAVSSMAALASAHVLMTNPVPYGKASLNNSPLDANGADFPCKQRADVYDLEGASNIYAQGSTQHLAFEGSSVHGGGSCQVSVTTDLHPDKNSVWKVIKSIEGGCPAKNTKGNLGSDATMAVPFTYDFDIPEKLAAGNYTLAWTWFNKVGNREMYMNCAPVTVTGNTGVDSYWQSLPDMFIANIKMDAKDTADEMCSVPPNVDVKFPNPGKFVDQFNGVTAKFWSPSKAVCTQGPAALRGPKELFADDGHHAAVATAAPQLDDSTQGSDAVFATDAPAAPTAESDMEMNSVNDAAGTPTSTPTPTPISGDSPAAGFPAAQKCTDEGQWNCVDGLSFQRCASGQWSVVQALATGVGCTKGLSSDFPVFPLASKPGAMRRARLERQ
ncbi:hypothetical protein VHEMI01005 [[Torrubiella] hemipterigena]|uniref:Chitin-binding type-4 domain-containing protein n=1 Tax=[Torrubiella] hemipterigena TaxID=1531966 RepID=A0A0A1T427_9HYPO|nr:hypothetical protein VHEMI01005 [[Torrubiella] hemipterigena]